MAETSSEWHGVPRKNIEWYPAIDHDLCVGCGLCVLGCGPHVYDFDFKKNKAMVVAPYRCKVGCVTCANTCPAYAISFPSLSYLHKVIKKQNVLTVSRSEIKDNETKYRYEKHEG